MKILNSHAIRYYRAFTLVESAITLAIVGVVLCAIWVAASSVVHGNEVKSGSETALMIVDNMHAFYSSQSKISIKHTGENSDMTEDVWNAGVFPNKTTKEDNTRNIWGGKIWITKGSDNTHFRLYMDGMSAEDCLRLTASMLGSNGLTQVLTAQGWKNLTDVTPTNFACPATCPIGGGTSSSKACSGLEFSLWYEIS